MAQYVYKNTDRRKCKTCGGIHGYLTVRDEDGNCGVPLYLDPETTSTPKDARGVMRGMGTEVERGDLYAEDLC